METELTQGMSKPASTPQAVWAIRTGDGADEGSRRSPAGFFSALSHRVAASGLARALFAYWLRRALRTLSDRQLRDAGIDPAKAGRGRAADARFDPNIGSGY